MILNIYTDASTLVHDDNLSGVGVVVTIDGEIFKTIGQHVGYMNIIDAELIAMVIGLKEAEDVCSASQEPVTLIRIISDCMSALDLATGEGTTKSDLTWQILDKIDDLCNRIDTPIEFQWVKAHNGNQYNEIADSLAYEHAHN